VDAAAGSAALPRVGVGGFPGADGFARGAEAVRLLAQSGLNPSNCRLLDALEAANSGAGNDAVLLVAFESADHPLEAWMARALEIAAGAGGVLPEGGARTKTGGEGARDGAAGAWRDAFLNAPYLRDVLARAGVVSETFETAIPWNRFAEFHDGVMQATRDAVAARVRLGDRELSLHARLSRRTRAVLHDPRAGQTRLRDRAVDEIKAAASEALIRLGGTITHHHAVGRDHRPGYDRERPPLFANALAAAKRALDPAGVLNPGVLLDPQPLR